MSRRLKVGLIGAGRIGRLHAENVDSFLQDRAEIAAAADLYPEKIADWAGSLGLPTVCRDPGRILADPEIDAVLICSSTDTHCSLISDAARQGKHIFCEKPVDLDAVKIREALAEVQKAQVKLQIGFQRRFDPSFAKIKAMIGAGEIGRPHLLKITSRDPEPPPLDYIKVSGGLFLDMTIHDFDMARFLLESEVEEVFASGAVLIDPTIGAAGDVDTAVVILKFQNGALGVIDNSRKAVYGYDQRVEVFGAAGSLAAGHEKETAVEHSTGEGIITPKPKYFFTERYREAYRRELESFFDAVIADSEPLVSGIDGLIAVLIGEAAKRSLAENRPVQVEL